MMQPAMNAGRAQDLLRRMLGPEAEFRDGQWQAIDAIVTHRERVLVVQCTGWGKSLVYFLSTKLLREQGAGPTILVSPLLSLMRNQIEAASRIGVRAFTINSSNRAEWDSAEAALAGDTCDILLISPERLVNDRFMRSLLPRVSGRAGLLVVDEVHITDSCWTLTLAGWLLRTKAAMWFIHFTLARATAHKT